MVSLRLAMLWLGLAAPGTGGPGVPSAEVAVALVDVFSEPDGGSYLTGSLKRGARLVVRETKAGGWLAIDPPSDALDWVDSRSIAETGDKLADVIVAKAEVRSGRPDARWPGPPVLTLAKGDKVKLLDVPPLKLKVGRKGTITWRAIRPPPRDVRYVRAESIRPIGSAATLKDTALHPAGAADGPIPPEVADELVRIDASYRSVLRGDLDDWDLAPILSRYNALLKKTDDPNAKAALSNRIARAKSHAELADSAKRFSGMVKESRLRDSEIEQVKARIARLKDSDREAYTAIGMIQPSSRQLDGHRVHALIGSDGTTVAYLDIPPGVDVDGLMTRRVGVRGTLRFDEKLGARYIIVRDVEPLKKAD